MVTDLTSHFRTLQPRLFEQFQKMIQSKQVSHAYLFSGSFFSEEAALWLAQSQFCENAQEGLPCQNCRSCRLILEHSFSDVKMVSPVNNVIKTDTIRELTKEFTRSSFEGKAQVFIIKDADKMHLNAANSLLKFIEEPQGPVHVIFLTSDSEKILGTIRSRCQIVHFPKNKAYLEQLLQEEGLLLTQARVIADLVKTINEARQLAQQPKFLELMAQSEKFLKSWENQPNQAYLEVAKLVALCPEKVDQERAFDLLMIGLAREGYHLRQAYFEKVNQARLMWQANVSYQNTLEYMLLVE